MSEEFDFYQRLEDGYTVEDVLEIIGITPSELYSCFLDKEIQEHREEFSNV